MYAGALTFYVQLFAIVKAAQKQPHCNVLCTKAFSAIHDDEVGCRCRSEGAELSPYNRISGGGVSKFDSYSLRFLESSDNVKESLRLVTGRTPNAEVATGAAICLQQGRMFVEASAESPMEIRPLLLFYGIAALAKAIVVGRNLKSLATLSHAHGLHDVSAHKARLADLEVKIEGNGTFQLFNDTVCELEGIKYFEGTALRKQLVPTAKSAHFDKEVISLKEILARTPTLENLFQLTFREPAKTYPFEIYLDGSPTEPTSITVRVPEIGSDRASLRAMVESLRMRFPILRKWRIANALIAWDNSIIVFANTPREGIDEFGETGLSEGGGNFSAIYSAGTPHLDFRNLLEPVAGGISEGYASFVTPLDEQYISELSLLYMGMFLLSSLVRYRPQIWVHAVSRFSDGERPADDQALALTEQFMRLAESRFLDAAVRLLSPKG